MRQRVDHRFWLNLAGFQLAWWACALGGNQGALLALLWLAAHLVLQPQPAVELRVVLVCGGLGLLTDAALTAAGWLRFPQAALLPWWLAVLWGCFAATLCHSLAALRSRHWLAATLGASGGPLSYYAGSSLGKLTFAQPLHALMLLALVWALLLPLLLHLAARLSVPPPEPETP